MRLNVLILLALTLLARPAPGQQGDLAAGPAWTFLPGGAFVAPLTASEQEPRVGIQKEFGSSKLKLDIGSSIDVVEYRDRANLIRLGFDFFTFALTTSAQGLRLQVDAVDGFFGGHVTFVPASEWGEGIQLRLRILHQSGHLIDGHWDSNSGKWRDGKEPIPYTRDFGEFLAAYRWSWEDIAMRIYSGASYATLARPDDLARWGSLHGMEVYTTGLSGSLFDKPLIAYAAMHLALNGIPTYYVTERLEAGFKLGSWEGTGIRLHVSYRNGLEPFSQYYFVRREYWSGGITMEP
ncbi:MAG: hypothetical protein AB1428_04335 [Bacteroidota bacterium]